MAGPNKDGAAVTTFADFEVIVPPNKLRKALVKAKSNAVNELDPVARAEQALAELASEFAVWMEMECIRLDIARQQVRSGGWSQPNRDQLFRAAHDIKGQAATFGFPLIAPVAESLCRLIEHTPDPASIPPDLIDQHVDGIRAISRRNTAAGDVRATAMKLAASLRNVTDEFLVHVNQHRPSYLADIIGPPTAPDDQKA